MGVGSLRRFCRESDLFHSSGCALDDACIFGACKGCGLLKCSDVATLEVTTLRCVWRRGVRLTFFFFVGDHSVSPRGYLCA